MFSKLIFTLLTAAILTISGATTGMAGPCDGSGDGTGNGYAFGNGNGNGAGNGEGAGDCIVDDNDGSNAAADLTSAETDWLLYMREEEKVARDVYLELGGLWGLLVFENIAISEQRHMDAMKKLIDCYKLTDPVIDQFGVFWNPKLQALFDSLTAKGALSMMDGLIVGAMIEETDILDIQIAIEETSHDHINDTYQHLMCGSRNHLRAFVRQIESNGGTYTPTVMEAAEFWEIAYSDMEQNCGNSSKKGKGKK